MWDEETWLGVCEMLDVSWPGDLSEEAAAAMRPLLQEHRPEQVVGAVRALLRTHKFRPSVAEVVQAIEGDARRPTWAEAYAVLYGRRSPLGRRTTAEAVEAAMAHHPLIARFVQVQGRDYLARLEVHDPEYGGAKRRALEKAWDQMVEAQEGRDVAALVASGGERRGELARFDPLRALGGARPELPGGDAA